MRRSRRNVDRVRTTDGLALRPGRKVDKVANAVTTVIQKSKLFSLLLKYSCQPSTSIFKMHSMENTHEKTMSYAKSTFVLIAPCRTVTLKAVIKMASHLRDVMKSFSPCHIGLVATKGNMRSTSGTTAASSILCLRKSPNNAWNSLLDMKPSPSLSANAALLRFTDVLFAVLMFRTTTTSEQRSSTIAIGTSPSDCKASKARSSDSVWT
mmetsp:Transcript_114655/g.286624  ORF Transcript_114655/g.286624 Transcript_114655/m.286624 type:complete len:209 (+) Transcript_114655:499-1125(+)